MASGKTTLGRAAAKALGLEFSDLDQVIERQQGTTIDQIFNDRGEDEFRRLESAALREIVAGGYSGILACGGGTPCNPANMRLMLKAGIVVWLQCHPGRIVERLNDAPDDQRPLARQMAAKCLRHEVDLMLAERAHTYSNAHITIDTTRMDSAAELEQVVNTFTAEILQYIMHNT